MNKKVLVVEGNTRETWETRQELGGVPYHIRFLEMLQYLRPDLKAEVVFPSESTEDLPNTSQLKNYHGVLWTGSGLYINDESDAVSNQLNFADEIFDSGLPIYGSCWGMQIAAKVAGGSVLQSDKGRELGVTSPISLTESGQQSPFFKDRKSPFHALCVHLDEVVNLPSNTTVLAYNDHSNVQSVIIKYKNSEFFGVQYHPEFKASDIAFLTKYLANAFIKEGRFNSESEVEQFLEDLETQTQFEKDIYDYSLHTQEVKAWLDACI